MSCDLLIRTGPDHKQHHPLVTWFLGEKSILIGDLRSPSTVVGAIQIPISCESRAHQDIVNESDQEEYHGW